MNAVSNTIEKGWMDLEWSARSGTGFSVSSEDILGHSWCASWKGSQMASRCSTVRPVNSSCWITIRTERWWSEVDRVQQSPRLVFPSPGEPIVNMPHWRTSHRSRRPDPRLLLVRCYRGPHSHCTPWSVQASRSHTGCSESGGKNTSTLHIPTEYTCYCSKYTLLEVYQSQNPYYSHRSCFVYLSLPPYTYTIHLKHTWLLQIYGCLYTWYFKSL